MSQNVTLSATISPVQWLAVQALVSGSSVTKAAEEAGVARETVSRWVHHDPVFIAELQNARAELAAQTRSALEALGMRAVATLRDAIANQYMEPTRLRGACALLKMLGADRAQTLAPTTPLEVDLRLRQREEELRKRLAELEKGDRVDNPSSAVIPDSTAAPVPPPAEAGHSEESAGGSSGPALDHLAPSGESEPHGELAQDAAPVNGHGDLVREWTEFLKEVMNQPPATDADQPVNGTGNGETLTEILLGMIKRGPRPAPPIPPRSAWARRGAPN